MPFCPNPERSSKFPTPTPPRHPPHKAERFLGLAFPPEMILRTPLQKKRRSESIAGDHESPVSDRRLVLYNDPGPITTAEPAADVVCTYHCRQMVKSEFMVALNAAEEQVLAYQTKLDALNKELCESEDEKKKCRNRICVLEQELEASKGREHALQERMLKEVGDSMERYQGELKRRSELEMKLRKEVESRKNAELSIASANGLAKDLEGRLQRLSDSADRERSRLEREISHLQNESKLLALNMSTDLEKLTLKAQNSEKESELLKEQLANLRKQLDVSLNQLSEAEHKLASYASLSHESTSSDDKKLVKHLQEELKKYEAEVQEARMLKASHVDGALLKEKLLEEKGRREKVELEMSRLQEVELHAQKVELELISWKSLLKEIPDVSCFSDIPKKFSALQKEAITNMMEVGEVKTRLKQLELDLELVQHKKEDAEKESMLNKDKANNATLEIKRLELMLSSVTEERDRHRREVAMLSQQKSDHLEGGLATETPSKDLDSCLAKSEETIRELEIHLHEQQDLINRQHGELKLLNEKLSDESRRVKSLEREGDRLRSEISLLESKLGHGDYSVENTKVLRMVNTLSVDNETKHTIEALRDELKKTQEKLQALEELKGQSDAGIIIDAGIPEKLAQLKGQIAVLEKREERYKAVFAERISVFRRACCSLFGYKIVMDDQQRANGIPVTRFTLQSIYAQSDDEKLEFEYESGSTNILVNGYSSQGEISHQIEIFIKKMNSIPAFTANLTMESFNKRTLC